MKRAIVLGAGPMGAAIAADLAEDSGIKVSVADISSQKLKGLTNVPKLAKIPMDLSDPRLLKALVGEYDLVVGALPSSLGFNTLRAVIESGRPSVDISFMREDAFELDDLAKERGVTAVVDCGVAPGLSNLIIGYCHSQLEITDKIECIVGGLPKIRRWPFQFKAPFSIADVLEEYTRPVHLVENGQMVVKPSLSDPELIDFPGIGTLEAFNTDGLRSLLRTVRARSMKEKTLRYPGHRDLMLILRESGFLQKEGVDINGTKVSPLDVTTRLLLPQWAPVPGEEEFTILRVIVEGYRGGKRARYEYEMYDEFDRESGRSSMARTTGYPCAVVARMLAQGVYRDPGVHPPEHIGMLPGMLTLVLEALKQRGIVVRHRLEEPGGTQEARSQE